MPKLKITVIFVRSSSFFDPGHLQVVIIDENNENFYNFKEGGERNPDDAPADPLVMLGMVGNGGSSGSSSSSGLSFFKSGLSKISVKKAEFTVSDEIFIQLINSKDPRSPIYNFKYSYFSNNCANCVLGILKFLGVSISIAIDQMFLTPATVFDAIPSENFTRQEISRTEVGLYESMKGFLEFCGKIEQLGPGTTARYALARVLDNPSLFEEIKKREHMMIKNLGSEQRIGELYREIIGLVVPLKYQILNSLLIKPISEADSDEVVREKLEAIFKNKRFDQIREDSQDFFKDFFPEILKLFSPAFSNTVSPTFLSTSLVAPAPSSASSSSSSAPSPSSASLSSFAPPPR